MTKLLFVCTGNICRSAFAERYVASRYPDVLSVTSAGTGAVVGAPMDAMMADQLRTWGGEAEGFRARQLEGDMVSEADLILTMEDHHRSWILDDHPGAVRRTFTLGQAVRAQEGFGEDGDLLQLLSTYRQRARGRDNIADPYRRGEAAMHTAATEIASRLDSLIPRLAARG
ncbi:low molecular weight phosphatase family protein [Dermacoccaceae bacterium W4C1]